MWAFMPFHRDMVVAMFTEPKWDLGYEKLEKLVKDGVIGRLNRDSFEDFIYFMFIYFLAYFSSGN